MVKMAAAMDKSRKRSMIFCSFCMTCHSETLCKTGALGEFLPDTRNTGRRSRSLTSGELVAGLNASMSTTHRHKNYGCELLPFERGILHGGHMKSRLKCLAHRSDVGWGI